MDNMTTKEILASKLEQYLNHELSKSTLILWCEESMQNHNFENETVQSIVARIGLMDTENFELSYEDLTNMLNQLGYKIRVEVH